MNICFAIGSYESNAWKSGNPNSGVYITETAKTLDALTCGYPACQQGGVVVGEVHQHRLSSGGFKDEDCQR